MPENYNIADLAEFIRKSKNNQKPFVFFTGAGCSLKGGIPLAKTLIEEMQKVFKTELKLLDDADRQNYGKCMAQIGLSDRREFLKNYIDNAKINWAHIALACLLKEGYIGRVLTFNFDNLLARSCGLLGLYPAIYDFTAANLNLHHLIDNPAIVHLHGQIYGFAQLNSDQETAAHAAQLSNFVCSTLNESPALFIGYSGQADAFFPQIKNHYTGQHRLFWVGMEEQAPSYVAESFLQTDLAHYMCCADGGSDVFLIELAQQLECFPPLILTNPYSHVIKELEAVTNYPQNNKSKKANSQLDESIFTKISENQNILQEVQLLQGVRQRLVEAQKMEVEHARYLELYLEGKYQEIIKHSKSVEYLDNENQIHVANAYLILAIEQNDLQQAIVLYDELIQRFGKNCEPEIQELVADALFNKGVSLLQLRQLEESILAYDELILFFAEINIPVSRVEITMALTMLNKSISLELLRRSKDAIKLHEEIFQMFISKNTIPLQKIVAESLFRKGLILRRLGLLEDAIAAYNEIINYFGERDTLSLQVLVANAFFHKGIIQGQLERSEDEITMYNQVIERFSSSDSSALQEIVARTMLYKGMPLLRIGDFEQAITVYDELIKNFILNKEPKVQEQVAEAFLKKGIILTQLKRTKDAITAYDDLILLFGESSVQAIQETVTNAKEELKKVITLD